MTEREAYEIYAAQTDSPKSWGALNQSYQRHGVWFLRGYHCGTVAAVDQKTGEVS